MLSDSNPTADRGGSAARTPYRLRLAQSDDDVRTAQRLRFLVFNVELREGLEESYRTCLDADRFDPVCDHLLVEHAASGEVVGTYRLQSGGQAAQHLGYYSAQEFDFSPFEAKRAEIIELGRACIHRDHRHFGVLNLLWKGIAQYARSHQGRYLIGCSSLTSQNAAEGWAAYERMAASVASPEWRTTPLPAFACPRPAEPLTEAVRIPKLLGAYLSLGARICGPPALDREFKTIDFLTVLDLHRVPEAVAARFLE